MELGKGLECEFYGGVADLFRLNIRKRIVLQVGIRCPGKWLSKHPWRYLQAVQIWHLGHGLRLDLTLLG